MIAFSVAVSGCSNNNALEANAEEVVDCINNNDMSTLQKIVMENNLLSDDSLSEFFETEIEDDNPDESEIISEIIAQDSIKLKKINDNSIEYELKTPKLENIFQDALEQDLEDDEIEDYFREYIRTADKDKCNVEVPYTYNDGVFKADYATEEFVNALTGGMIKSYQELVQKMLQEMGTEVE